MIVFVTFEKTRDRWRWRSTIIRGCEGILFLFDLVVPGGYSLRTPLKFAHLLFKVPVKRVVDDSDPLTLQLILIQVNEYGRDVIQQLVNPSEVNQRLVDGLYVAVYPRMLALLLSPCTVQGNSPQISDQIP